MSPPKKRKDIPFLFVDLLKAGEAVDPVLGRD